MLLLLLSQLWVLGQCIEVFNGLNFIGPDLNKCHVNMNQDAIILFYIFPIFFFGPSWPSYKGRVITVILSPGLLYVIHPKPKVSFPE